MSPTKTREPAPANHVTVTITLNGTDTNPYLRLGLTRNPFPASGIAEHAHLNKLISELAATPLPTVEKLVEWLKDHGVSEELVAVCSEEHRVGRLVSFDVHFPRGT